MSSNEVASEGRREWQRRGGTSPAAYADYLSPDAVAGEERRGGMTFAAEQTEPVGGAASGIALPSIAGLWHGHPVPAPRVSATAWASVSCFPAPASHCAAASVAAAGENAAAATRSRAPRMKSGRRSWRGGTPHAHCARQQTTSTPLPSSTCWCALAPEPELRVAPPRWGAGRRGTPPYAGGAAARGGREEGGRRVWNGVSQDSAER